MPVEFPPRDASLRFLDQLDRKYASRAPQPTTNLYVDPEGLAVWHQEFLRHMVNGQTEAEAWALVEASIDAIWHPPPTPPPTGDWTPVAPLRGYLRKGPNATFADDGGPRSVRACSYFPALRIFRDSRDECLRNLDRIIGKWQAVRVFWHLADPWAPFGRDVRPSWSNFDEVFTGFLAACWERQIRVSLTSGDHQFFPDQSKSARIALYLRIANLCRSVNEQVVCFTGAINEARVNSHEGEDWAFWAAMSHAFQSRYPWGQHGLSDPGGQEEPDDLVASAQAPATAALLHGTRHGWSDAIRRAFNVRYEGVRTIPINQDEPTNLLNPQMRGPNIRVYQPLATRQEVFGLYSMIVLTGQLLTYFGDCGLTNTDRLPLDSDWGFTELPRRWQQMGVPEDIGTYRLIPGHHADAPVSAQRFQVPHGAGPDRVDNMVAQDGKRGFAIAYGGSGTYGLYHRAGTVDGRIWGPDGVLQPFLGTAAVPSSHQAVVVDWVR